LTFFGSPAALIGAIVPFASVDLRKFAQTTVTDIAGLIVARRPELDGRVCRS